MIQLQTEHSGLVVFSFCLEGSHFLGGVMVGVVSPFILISKATHPQRTSVTTCLYMCAQANECTLSPGFCILKKHHLTSIGCSSVFTRPGIIICAQLLLSSFPMPPIIASANWLYESCTQVLLILANALKHKMMHNTLEIFTKSKRDHSHL